MTAGATPTAVLGVDEVGGRAALVATVNGLFGFDVVASVPTGREALAAAAEARPDLVVLDLALSGDLGLRIVPALRAASPGCAVVVVAAPPFATLRRAAVEAGALALVTLADLRPLRPCLAQVHRRAHGASGCDRCRAAMGPATGPAQGVHRRSLRRRASGVVMETPSSASSALEWTQPPHTPLPPT